MQLFHLLAAFLTMAASAQQPQPEIPAPRVSLTTHDSNLYLFVEDHWIAEHQGLRRIGNRATVLEKPVIWPDEPQTGTDYAWGHPGAAHRSPTRQPETANRCR